MLKYIIMVQFTSKGVCELSNDDLENRKDLGHFPYQSAHGKGMSWACGITAQVLTLHCDKIISWLQRFICDPEPSRCPRSPCTIHWEIFEVQSVYDSWASLKILFTQRSSMQKGGFSLKFLFRLSGTHGPKSCYRNGQILENGPCLS